MKVRANKRITEGEEKKDLMPFVKEEDIFRISPSFAFSLIIVIKRSAKACWSLELAEAARPHDIIQASLKDKLT
jgi:hypothetical protein